MQSILHYIILIAFSYALISLPIPNGDWQEYLLLGASLAIIILSIKEDIDFEKTKRYRGLIGVVIILGVYWSIFYMLSDWSSLETTSLVILCLGAVINFVRLLVRTYKKN
jgi:predicted neutral ceramidase superfamily lipid hydrolase